MRKLLGITTLSVIAVCPFIARADDDPITTFLNKKGFSNVAYSDQHRAKPGGYVAYDTEHKNNKAMWYLPVEGENVELQPGVDDIIIPGETIKKAWGLGIDAKIFGISPIASLKSTGTLDYDTLTLKPIGVGDANSFYNSLLKPGAPLEKEFLEYGDSGNGGVRVYSNQHLYGIETVYYATGIRSHTTSGHDFSLAVNANTPLDNCSDKDKRDTDAKPENSGKKPDGRPKAGEGQGAKPTQETGLQKAENAGAAALTSLGKVGKATADTAKSAASGAAPGIGGTFCKVDDMTAEYRSDKPIALAVQLLRAEPDGDGWNLLETVVKFDGKDTKEYK